MITLVIFLLYNIQDISDERLQLVNELLHGIRLLKLLGWEEYYLKKINKVRDNEVKLLNKDSRYWAVMSELYCQNILSEVDR